MNDVVPTLFFHDWTITSAEAGASDHGHTFGGPPAHAGATRERCNDRLLHLLHHINLADPLIPIEIPEVQWLPLYYCFDFRVNELGYRLTSGNDLVAFFDDDDPHVTEEEGFPSDDFPTEFPKCDIALSRFPYDPGKRDDAYQFGAVFGLDRLSAADRKSVLDQHSDDLAMLLDWRPESEEELLDSLSFPFVQGRPISRCLNPECTNHSVSGKLRTIALMPSEPVPGVYAFGTPSHEVQVIFELCPECQTIHVSNQCT